MYCRRPVQGLVEDRLALELELFAELEVLPELEFVIMELVDVTLVTIGMLVELTIDVLLETAGAQEFVVSAEIEELVEYQVRKWN